MPVVKVGAAAVNVVAAVEMLAEATVRAVAAANILVARVVAAVAKLGPAAVMAVAAVAKVGAAVARAVAAVEMLVPTSAPLNLNLSPASMNCGSQIGASRVAFVKSSSHGTVGTGVCNSFNTSRNCSMAGSSVRGLSSGGLGSVGKVSAFKALAAGVGGTSCNWRKASLMRSIGGIAGTIPALSLAIAASNWSS